MGIGALFFGLGFFLFLTSVSRNQKLRKESELGVNKEWTWVAGLVALAFVLRVFRLDSQPPGIYIDQCFGGWEALRILHEGLRPFGMQEIIYNWPLPLYQLALWFWLFKPTAWFLLLFFVTAGLAAFPFIYLVFRHLAGAPTALGTLFFLTIMFWHINTSRNGLWTVLPLFYIFVALFFLLNGFKTFRQWKFVLAALFFAAGFYTYQSYKVFPILLLIYLFYEYRFDAQGIQSRASGLLLFTALSIGLCFPLGWDWFQHGIFSDREKSIFIGRIVQEQNGLKPLWGNIFQWALSFNHQGAPDPLNRVGQRPMLDPVTGVLFLFGFFYSLKTPFRKDHFYSLAGFFVMSLPTFLSFGGSYRMACALPFVAFFAAQALTLLWDGVVQTARGKTRLCILCAFGGMLLYAGFQNSKSYFVDLVQDNDRWLHFSMDANSVGKAVEEHPDTDFCLPPYFCEHPTVLFLSYFQKSQIHRLEIPTGLVPDWDSPRTQVCFAVEKGKEGWLDLLQSLYPGGRKEQVKDLNGDPIVTFYYVSRQTVDSFRGLRKLGPEEWKGSFRADRTGLYRFYFQTNPDLLEIGGCRIREGTALNLLKGFYSFRLKTRFLKEKGLFFLDPQGKARALDDSCLTSLPLNHGLLCRYSSAHGDAGAPFRWDPLINFVSTGDLPYPSFPFQADWTGRLFCPSKGRYGFLLLTNVKGQLWLDGKKVLGGIPGETAILFLTEGFHDIQLTALRDQGEKEVRMDFHLLWEKPGQTKYEIVPATAFGKTQCL